MSEEPKRTLSDDEANAKNKSKESFFDENAPPIVVVSSPYASKPKPTLKGFAWGLVVLGAYVLLYASLLAWLGSELYSNITGKEMSFEMALNYVVLLALAGRALDLFKLGSRNR